MIWDFSLLILGVLGGVLLLTWPLHTLLFITNIPPIARNEFICIELVLMWNTDLSHVMQPKRNQMDIFLRLSGHVLFVCTSYWGHNIFGVRLPKDSYRNGRDTENRELLSELNVFQKWYTGYSCNSFGFFSVKVMPLSNRGQWKTAMLYLRKYFNPLW